MPVTIPQLIYWLAYTMDKPTADAFKNSGAITANDAATVEATVGSPIIKPLLEALRASTSPAPGVAMWKPVCRLPTLQALAQTPPPAGGV
jgi:hypothetical protein